MKHCQKEEAEKADENGIKPSDYIIHDEKEAKALCAEIQKLDNVASVVYVSSEEGLESVKESMLEGQEEYFSFLDDENPMSCAAKVTMKDMARFDETIKQIKKLSGVERIVSQSDLASTINAIKQGVGVAGFWIIAILMIIMFVVSVVLHFSDGNETEALTAVIHTVLYKIYYFGGV